MYNLLNTADHVLNKLANSPAAEKLTPELSSLFSHEFTYKSPPPNVSQVPGQLQRGWLYYPK
jgi:hypothetical protein